MAPFVADGVAVRAGVGLADDATLPLTEMIEARLRSTDLVVELVRYRGGLGALADGALVRLSLK